LDGVAVHPQLVGESFSAKSGRLPEQLQQEASDNSIPRSSNRTTATSTSGR
jgi:hypothetical protein